MFFWVVEEVELAHIDWAFTRSDDLITKKSHITHFLPHHAVHVCPVCPVHYPHIPEPVYLAVLFGLLGRGVTMHLMSSLTGIIR